MKAVKIIFYFLFAIFMTANLVYGNILNVPSQYTTIQSAINASVNADTVLVQPGTYFENINFRGKRIVLTSKYYINNDYSFLQSTIIDGRNPAFPDTASCVIFNRNEDSSTVLQGFTLTGGKGTKWTDEHGAGLFREGGGILIAYSSPVVQFNIISGNSAVTGGVVSTGGGGMRIGDCYARVHNNIVTNNTGRYGAGIVLNYTGGEYKNNLIYKNYGSLDYGAGSGIWVNGSNARQISIENNTVVANTSTTGTPGVFSFGGALAKLRNNIVWGNTAPSGLQISGSGLTVSYCDVQNGFNGAGNMNFDPQFDSTNYYLKSTSPCIDKGDSSLVYNDPADLNNPTIAKYPSRGGLRNDIGAYGGQFSSVIANTIVGINLNGQGGKISPDNFHLNQNYPNPFNPTTKINYELRVTNYVSLIVYDLLGEIVSTLINQKQDAGSYNIEFDGSGLSSGIYFYKLTTGSSREAGGFSETKQMILLK